MKIWLAILLFTCITGYHLFHAHSEKLQQENDEVKIDTHHHKHHGHPGKGPVNSNHHDSSHHGHDDDEDDLERHNAHAPPTRKLRRKKRQAPPPESKLYSKQIGDAHWDSDCPEKFKTVKLLKLGKIHSYCLTESAVCDDVHTVSEQDKKTILHEHNRYRQKMNAESMFKLQWSDELARTSQGWCGQDIWAHDYSDMRNRPNRYLVGQNLATSSVAKSWKWVVKFWYDEITSFQLGVGSTDGNMVGHFTQVVHDQTYKVGCAQAHCPHSKMFIYCCDYGPAGNIAQKPGEDPFAHPYKKKTGKFNCQASDTEKADSTIDGEICDCGKNGLPKCDLTEDLDPSDCKCRVKSIPGVGPIKNCPPIPGSSCSTPDDFADCPDDPDSMGCCCTKSGEIVKTSPSQPKCMWAYKKGDNKLSVSTCKWDSGADMADLSTATVTIG